MYIQGNKSRGPANGWNGQFSRGLCWFEDSMTKQHVYDQGHPSNDSDEKKKRKWDTWISGYRSTFEPITDRILFTVKPFQFHEHDLMALTLCHHVTICSKFNFAPSQGYNVDETYRISLFLISLMLFFAIFWINLSGLHTFLSRLDEISYERKPNERLNYTVQLQCERKLTQIGKAEVSSNRLIFVPFFLYNFT